MKPLHIFLLLFAVFIWGLADGLEAGFLGLGLAPAAIPVAGVVVAGITEPLGVALGITVGWCINVTMGCGLLLLLVMNGMYHPKFGQIAAIGAFIPGLDAFPFLIGLVITGIFYDLSKEKGLLGAAARVAVAAQSPSLQNTASAAASVKNIQSDIQPSYAQKAA
jgi:hypothetical protein